MGLTHEFEIKAGNTLPSLSTVLLDGYGKPVNLTDAVSVTLSMKLAGHPRTVVIDEQPAAFSPSPSGAVTYSWGANDTAVPGVYEIEWDVSWGLGLKATFPSHGFDKVRVGPAI